MGRKKPPAARASAPRSATGHATLDAGATLDELAAAVRLGKGSPERFLAIAALTDAYCLRELEPLGMEYRDMCRVMAASLCGPRSPVVNTRTTAEGWAAAVVAAVGFVNFLGDKETPPTRTMAQVAAGLGVSESGLAAKSVKVRKMLDLGQFDPAWTLPSLLDQNPFVWMLETTDGLVVDVRHCTREEQARAFEMGLIPYIPADRPPTPATPATPAPTSTSAMPQPKREAAAQPPRERPPVRPPVRPPLWDEGPSLFDPGAAAIGVEIKPDATGGVIARIGGAKGRE